MKRTILILLVPLILAFAAIPANAANIPSILDYMETRLYELNNTGADFWTASEMEAILANIYNQGYPLSDVTVDQLTIDKSIHKFEALRILAESELGSMMYWNTANKNRWQTIAVKLGALDAVNALVPINDEISEEKAHYIALSAIKNKYDLSEDELSKHVGMSYGYSSTGAKEWNFTFETLVSSITYKVTVYPDASIGLVEKYEIETLEAFSNSLYDEKGSFQFWSAEDKAWFSQLLPDMIAEAEVNGEHIPHDLPVIADYGFLVPNDRVITQHEAEQVAHRAITVAFILQEQWEADFNIGASLFPRDDAIVWRIVYWPKNQIEMGSWGYWVEIDAETAGLLTCAPRSKDTHLLDLL